MLRRVLDVVLVLTPLLLSSLLTVVAAVSLHLLLNFANIIALPLLLGVGVSFNIYFVMNWRAGQTRPLGSATARAVVFFRADHRHGVRLAGAVASSGHCQHGHTAAAESWLYGGHHDGVPACAALNVGRR